MQLCVQCSCSPRLHKSLGLPKARTISMTGRRITSRAQMLQERCRSEEGDSPPRNLTTAAPFQCCIEGFHAAYCFGIPLDCADVRSLAPASPQLRMASLCVG